MAILLKFSKGATPFMGAGLIKQRADAVGRLQRINPATTVFRRPFVRIISDTSSTKIISQAKSPLLSSIQIRGGAEEERGSTNMSSSGKGKSSSLSYLSKQANAGSLFPRKSASRQRRSHSTTTSTEKDASSSPETNLQVSVCAAQGRRTYMEDEFVVAQDFAAVFDGHGGPSVSRYLKSNLFANLQSALPFVLDQKQQQHPEKEPTTTDQPNSEGLPSESTTPMTTSSEESTISDPSVQDYCVALRLALDKVDREVQRISHWSYQGSTAVAAWIHRDAAADTTTLIVANVGDSRAVYGCNGTAMPLTRDHKPDDPKETERIESLGGKVVWCGPYDDKGKPVLSQGIYRVNGNLALSRAIGDRSERPAVTADPDITYIKIQSDAEAGGQQQAANNKEYVVLATDGLWDVFTNEEVVAIIDLLLDRTRGERRHQQSQIADVLVHEALRRGAFDNITVIIIWLQTGENNEGEAIAQKDSVEPAS